MTADPRTMRMERRLTKGLFHINGVDMSPPEKTTEMGKKSIEWSDQYHSKGNPKKHRQGEKGSTLTSAALSPQADTFCGRRSFPPMEYKVSIFYASRKGFFIYFPGR